MTQFYHKLYRRTLSNTQEEIIVNIIVELPILLGKWYTPCVLSNHWSNGLKLLTSTNLLQVKDYCKVKGHFPIQLFMGMTLEMEIQIKDQVELAIQIIPEIRNPPY